MYRIYKYNINNKDYKIYKSHLLLATSKVSWVAYEKTENGEKRIERFFPTKRELINFLYEMNKPIATDCNCCDSRCMGGIDCKNADVDGFDIPSCV